MFRDLLSKGGMVMYPLLFCSIAAVAVILERAVFFVRLKRTENGLAERVEAFHRRLAAGDQGKALQLLKEGAGPVVRVLLAGMVCSDPRAARRGVEAAIGHERRRLFAGLMILDTIVTAAPLLGLLGTVLGILHTFNVLGRDPVTRNMQVVGNGIAEALITTAAGLVIAIPALVALNYFVQRAEAVHELVQREANGLDWGDGNGQVLEAPGQH